QRSGHGSPDKTGMIEEFLKLCGGEGAIAHSQIGQSAHVGWPQRAEPIGTRELVRGRGPKDFDGACGIVRVQFHRGPDRRQVETLNLRIDRSLTIECVHQLLRTAEVTSLGENQPRARLYRLASISRRSNREKPWSIDITRRGLVQRFVK